MKKIHFVLLFYTLLFAWVYFLTLNIDYVEGDDAATVLYHICGRNAAIQEPYAAYNSGFDFLLRISDGNSEPIMRSLAIHLSFIFGWLVICLCAIFIDLAAKEKFGNAKYVFLYLLPFIIPDFIFNSLLVNAANVSFAFALGGLIMFMKFFIRGEWKYYALSIFLLALSVPFRWSILIIFPVFFSILIFYPEKSIFYRIKMAVIHNALALAFGLVFITISGYSISKVYEIIIWGKKYMGDFNYSVLSLFATGSAFFTVTFTILLAIGLYLSLFRAKKQQAIENIIFILFPIVPFFILGAFPSLKFLITALPMLLFISLAGYAFIAQYKVLNVLFVAIVTLSWFVGIRVYATGTAAGPGFEQQIAGRESKTPINENNVDARIKIKSVKPVLGDGFYMPMLEGPRPLFGYFYVIFGGIWKNNISQFSTERTEAINLIKGNRGFIFLQDRKTAYIECDLYRDGYRTSAPFRHDKIQNLEYRDFYNGKDTIHIFVIPDTVNKIDFAQAFLAAHSHVVFRSSYSSIILSLIGKDNSLHAIGPYTIVKN